MPYATQDDLLQRMSLDQLTQLTDDRRQGVPDAVVVAAALEEASGKVDSYCRSRYQTPLQASDTATAITRDIAAYELFCRRPGKLSDVVRQRYEDALSLLKDISTGKAVLDQPASAAAPQTTTAGAVLPTCSRARFSDCDLKGFV